MLANLFCSLIISNRSVVLSYGCRFVLVTHHLQQVGGLVCPLMDAEFVTHRLQQVGGASLPSHVRRLGHPSSSAS